MQENVPVAGKQFGVTWVVFSGGKNGENFLAILEAFLLISYTLLFFRFLFWSFLHISQLVFVFRAKFLV